MNHGEFIWLINEAPVDYAVTLIMTLAVYLFIFRKQINSVFDPLFFATVYGALAGADVVFLWWQGKIDVGYFIQFLITDAAFFLGVLVSKPVKEYSQTQTGSRRGSRSFVLLSGGERPLLGALYVVSAITFVVTQAVTYAIQGIPILYRSRLDYYSGGGGIGVLDRILNVTWLFSCYLLIYRFATKTRSEGWPRVLDVFVGFALVASPVLSGSKSSFISIVFVIYYFRFFHRRDRSCGTADKVLGKLQGATVLFAVAAAAFVISVQGATTDPSLWVATLGVRFASFGDAFFMAYPSHVVDSIPGRDGFLAVFGGLLATFRIVPYEVVPEPLGYVLHRIVYGFDNSTGPNARHNVFGLVFFGQMGSICYSLIIGMIVGFIRNRLPAFIRPGSAMEPVFVFLAISCVGLFADLALVMKDIGSIILIMPFLYAISGLVYLAASRRSASVI